MILSAHQPQYLPYLGFFHKIAHSEVFVWLDDVQYKKREFQNRNRVRSPQGELWLTVPVRSKGRRDQLIRDVEVDEGLPWRRDHWESIRRNYARAPEFSRHAPFFETLYARAWDRLEPLCLEAASYLCRAFGISTPMRLASEFAVATTSTRRLVDICLAAKADRYLSGPGGKDYLEEGLFKEAGVALEYQRFEPPVYPQCHSGFIPNLSAVDYLFNVKPEEAAAYFRMGAR